MSALPSHGVGPKPTNYGAYAILSVMALFCLIPFVWLFLAWVDTNAQLFLKMPDQWTLDNYVRVFHKEDGLRWFVNSMFTVCTSTALVMVIAGLGGYALSRTTA